MDLKKGTTAILSKYFWEKRMDVYCERSSTQIIEQNNLSQEMLNKLLEIIEFLIKWTELTKITNLPAINLKDYLEDLKDATKSKKNNI